MKRIPLLAVTIALVAVFGCAPKAEEPAAQSKSDVLPMSYMDAASALSVDNFDVAKTALTTLSKETSGEMNTKAQAAADTKDIAAMREAFRELSTMAATMKLPPEMAVAYCPMYKGGSKWVQKKDKLANPYFGKAMQTCGSFANKT